MWIVTVLGAVGSVVTILAYLGNPRVRPVPSRARLLPLLALVLAATAGYLAFRAQELSSMQQEAADLWRRLPDHLDVDSTSTGECKGYALEGYQLVARYQRSFPRFADDAHELVVSHGVIKGEEPEYLHWVQAHRNACDAAQAMIEVIKAIGRK
jgi:hypothetical protein